MIVNNKNVFTILFMLIVLSVLSINTNSTPDTPMCQILTLRVDNDNRIFWNNCHPSDSLPKPIPNYPDSQHASINMFDTNILTDIIIDKYLSNNRKLIIVIYVHPKAHYVTVNNILTVFGQATELINEKTARELGVPVDSLNEYSKYNRPCYIKLWERIDKYIIEHSYRAANMEFSHSITIPEEFTFLYKLKNEYWKGWSNRLVVQQSYDDLINSRIPRIGIPKQIMEDLPIDEEIRIKSIKEFK